MPVSPPSKEAFNSLQSSLKLEGSCLLAYPGTNNTLSIVVNLMNVEDAVLDGRMKIPVDMTHTFGRGNR